MTNYASKATAKRGAVRKYGKDFEQHVIIVKGELETPEGSKGIRWMLQPIPIEPEAKTIVEKAPIKRKSEIKDPCHLVWDMADKMKGSRRKDIIAACVEQGVAFYTARTQYQLWFQSNKK